MSDAKPAAEPSDVVSLEDEKRTVEILSQSI